MTVVNPKSISGINSITTGSGSDNLLTIHTSDANNTERLRIDSTGTTKIVTGIVTTLTATTGIVTTLTTNTLTANSTTKVGSGVTLSPDGDIFATGISTFADGVRIVGGSNSSNLTVITSNNNVGIFSGTNSGANIQLFDNDTETLIRTVDGRLHIYADQGDAVADSELRFYVDGGLKGVISAGSSFSLGNDPDTFLGHPAANTLTVTTQGSERVRIDSSGNTNFGAEKSVALPSGTGIQVYHSTNPRIKLVNDTTGNGSTDGTQIYLSSDGDTIIDNKDSEDIIFHRNASEKLRITNGGLDPGTDAVTDIGNSSKRFRDLYVSRGVVFDAVAGNATSNTLDDYEEGTFSPAFKAENNSSNASTTVNEAQYTKIGDLVYFRFYIQLAAHASGTTGGNAFINGLPFTSVNGHSSIDVGYFANWNANQMFVTGTVQPGSNSLIFRHYTSASSGTGTMDYDNNLQVGSAVIVSGCYQTSS